MSHLTSRNGHLLSRSGHLFSDAGGCACCPDGGGGGACPCPDLVTPCAYCSDATPTQFHVSFTGISLCTACTDCSATSTSAKVNPGSSINGTYLLSKNGNCSWSCAPANVPATATFYTAPGCGGTSTPAQFAIDLTRISATQFRLQITDGTNTVLLFDATVDVATCCTGFTAANSLTGCACDAGTGVFALGSGGTATVTRC